MALKAKAELEGDIASLAHTTTTARDAFLDDLRIRRLSPRTLDGYEWALRTFFDRDTPLHALSPRSCAARYQQLVAGAPDRPALSVDSHRNCLKMARTFLRWCRSRGWLRTDPLAGVQGVGKRRRGKPQLRIDEARRFYAYALKRAGTGDPGAAAALMALLLTMRSESEVLACQARDVDDGGRLLWVEGSKSESSRRAEVVPEELRPALLALADAARARAEEARRANWPADEHLFRRQDRKWLWDEVTRLCAEAGVPRVSPHGLRGLHATLARQQGATSLLVAAALGHASPAVTERHYVDQEAAREADRGRALTVLRGGKAS